MSTQSSSSLIELVNNLTKGEKRHFRMFVNRTNPNEEKLFLQLFDFINKYGYFDEEQILKKWPRIKKRQLSNLKAHLYKQLLQSLRQQYRQHHVDMDLREHLDYAKILYNKGMYRASLQILDKVKKLAIQNRLLSDALTIIEFEKHIESQHITGSMYPKAEQITKETEKIIRQLSLRNTLSNLSLSLYGLYLQFGYIKDERDFHFITKYFKTHLPTVDIQELDFHEKMFLFQSYVWYYYMVQDFVNFYKYAQRWVDLFKEYPQMLMKETPLYLKAMHNVLTAYFMAQREDKFLPAYQSLLSFNDEAGLILSRNEESQFNLFKHIHGINKIFLTAEYETAIAELSSLFDVMDDNIYNWDLNRLLNFYYKIGCVYFGANDLDNAIIYLNKITNYNFPNFREDIQCYARILNLIAHFDLGNDLLVSYQIKSTYRYLLKVKQDQKVLIAIFAFLRRTPRMLESELKSEFQQLKNKLENLEKDPYEKRPFLYLDIISWLDSKINDRTMAESIRARKQLRGLYRQTKKTEVIS